MFDEIVIQIGCSWFPKHAVVALVDYILYPIETHIHCFANYFLYGVIQYTLRGWVICIHGHCLLWVENFLKVDFDWFPYFFVVRKFPTSSSTSDEVTFFMMLDSSRITSLDSLVSLNFLFNGKKIPPEQLLEYNSDRYDESLYLRNIISLKCNLNLASGFVSR